MLALPQLRLPHLSRFSKEPALSLVEGCAFGEPTASGFPSCSCGAITNAFSAKPARTGSFNLIASTSVEPIGPALTISVDPATDMLFVGIGLCASEGKNASFGPLYQISGTGSKDDVLSGGSISAGYNFPNLLGGQWTGNFSGSMGGATIGVTGAGAQATYSVGINLSTFFQFFCTTSRTTSSSGYGREQMLMKAWLVLLSADAVMCWWFANSMLMLLRPDRAKYFLWWPQLRETAETPKTVVLPRKQIRTLGFVFAVASGTLLLAVLVPATAGLVLSHFKW
jgi:hypothetical protein